MSTKMYTDDDLREMLNRALMYTTYRSLAARIDVDHAHLYRMVDGKMPISEKAAAYLGYTLADARWIRNDTTPKPKRG